jgi:hypothetical protein
MTALAEEAPVLQITEPGIYDGIPEDVYHGDLVPGGSLSVSGAKKLLAPSCPALFAWEREHPPPPKKAMELGTAAHTVVLGTGPKIVEIDAADWMKRATKERGAEVRAEGGVPLLTKDYRRVQGMAKALREHPIASALFDPERGGHAEQSFFWFDERWGIWRRGRMDWMPPLDRGRPVLGDYKSATAADLNAITKAVRNFRYEMQDDWYSDGIEAITGVRCPFLFVFQETTAPYLITVCQLDEETRLSGRRRNDEALEIYRDCTAAGAWPAYSDDIELISLPPWAQARGDYL